MSELDCSSLIPNGHNGFNYEKYNAARSELHHARFEEGRTSPPNHGLTYHDMRASIKVSGNSTFVVSFLFATPENYENSKFLFEGFESKSLVVASEKIVLN